VEAVVVAAPLELRLCPGCGRPPKPAGTQAAHEEIEWEVRLVRKRYHRQRYVRTCACPGVSTRIVAPAPVRLIPKGLLSLGTIAQQESLTIRPGYRRAQVS